MLRNTKTVLRLIIPNSLMRPRWLATWLSCRSSPNLKVQVHDRVSCFRSFRSYIKLTGEILADGDDIIDEAIYYFKANIFFRNYEIKVNCLFLSFPRF